MPAEIPAEALQLRSLVRADQTLELFLDMVPVSEPGSDEVLIRVEAAPLNPSDMGLLFAGADMAAAVASGSAQRPVITAPIPYAVMRGLAGRVGTPLPVGNEGAGGVVAAGGSAAAQALLGKVVAAAGGGMYSQYRPVNVLGLPLGVGGRGEPRCGPVHLILFCQVGEQAGRGLGYGPAVGWPYRLLERADQANRLVITDGQQHQVGSGVVSYGEASRRGGR